MTTPTAEPAVAEPALSTELDQLVTKALAEINSGSITFADLLKALSPAQQSAAPPAVLPQPAEITDEQRAAMAKVPDVFGLVVPTERRALEPVEVKALITEKQTLDTVKKMAETRLEDVKVTIHNHLDVEIEAALDEDSEKPLLDDKGHYITEGVARAPGETQAFIRDVKNYAASLSVDSLQMQEALGALTHEDFLAMTSQVRVVDEAKIMAVLKKKPALINAIASATTPGKKGTAIRLGKPKS